MSSAQPAAGRARGRPRALTRDQVVAAALAVAGREGAPEVSIRSVAREAGVVPMTIYTYFQGRAELSAAVLDAVIVQVEWADDEAPSLEQVVRCFVQLRATLARYPSLLVQIGLLVDYGPALLDFYERVLDLLDRLGVPESVAPHLFLGLYRSTYTAAIADGNLAASGRSTAEVNDHLAAQYDSGDRPHLREFARLMRGVTSDELFAEHIRVLAAPYIRSDRRKRRTTQSPPKPRL